MSKEPLTLSSIPPMDPEQTAQAVGARVVPVLTEEMMEQQVERWTDTGGAPGPLPGEWHPWLEEFCKGRVELIDKHQERIDQEKEEARGVIEALYHRELLLDGQRMLLGALSQGLEGWV